MSEYDDLLEGYEVKGKVIPEPVEKSKEADLFSGYEVKGKLIPDPNQTPVKAQPGWGEFFTGSARKQNNPELAELPEFGTTKEGDTPRIAAGFLSTFDPKAQMDMIKQAVPEARFEQTDDGTVIIEVPTDSGEMRRSVLNRPGFSPQDAMTATAQVLAFIPAAKLASLGKTLMAKIGMGAAGAGATEQLLQEGGIALGREERDPVSTGVAMMAGGAAEAIAPAIQGFRASRNAKQFGAMTDDIAQVSDNVAVAKEASEQTGVPLFQAQKTGVPATLEKQSFVAQLPAGTKSAVKALRGQNKAAGDAVENFLNTIAPPESVVTAQSRTRSAAQAAIDNAKRIRAEKTSPLYKSAFEKSADVNIAPIKDYIKSSLDDLPESGEVSKTLKKVNALMTGKAKEVDGKTVIEKPTLKLLHNAKLELDQMLSKQGENALGNTTKRQVTEIKDLLLQQMDEASPDYRAARELFAAESPPVSALQDSIVGKIADLDDTQLKSVTSKIFDPAQTNPQVVLKAREAITNTDPDAWNEIVRTELERRLGSIKATTESGTVENLPGQLYRALFPNAKSETVLMNALTAEQRKNMQYLKTALGRARLGRPGGSQTAAREEIKSELKGGLVQGFRDWLRNPISGAVDKGVSMITMAGEDASFNSRVSVLAKALYDPKWQPEMRALRQLKSDTPAAARAFTQLLNDIEQDEFNDSIQQQSQEQQ